MSVASEHEVNGAWGATPPRRVFWSRVSWVALVVALLYFAVRGPVVTAKPRLWDYAVCASSAYLWVHGQDPFDAALVNATPLERGRSPGIQRYVHWLRAIVPPTTLAVLAPFAALPPFVGPHLYLLTTAVLGFWAAKAYARWAGIRDPIALRFYAATLLASVPGTLGLSSGNPTMLATPLLLIGLERSFRGHAVLGGVMMGIGAACKVQIGVPIVAFWLIWGRWRAALVAAVTFGVIAAVGAGRLQLADVDWWGSWLRNVAETNGPGGLNDFSSAANPDDFLNLQVPLWAITQNRTTTQVLTYALWTAAAGAFGSMILRRVRARERHDPQVTLLGVAVVCLLMLLPVYHRAYDSIAMLPVLALAVRHVAEPVDRTARRAAVVALVLLSAFLIPVGLPSFLGRHGRIPDALFQSMLFHAIVVPIKAWATLGLAIVCIWAFEQAVARDDGALEPEEIGVETEKKSDHHSGSLTRIPK